jgi:hypothetical protein
LLGNLAKRGWGEAVAFFCSPKIIAKSQDEDESISHIHNEFK